MPGPLDGIRVLDLTQYVAGSLCTMLLGDFGADVIKIEPPTGDPLRATGETSVNGSGESEGFVAINRNKRSVVIDLKSPDGQELVRGLASGGDVVVENFRPGTAEKFGLGYDALAAINPRLVYCSVTGFGPTGSNRDRPAVDQVIQALSGIMQLTGTPESGPLRTGFPFADFVTPMFAAMGVLAALQARERTGRGQRVELSMLNATIFGMIPREGHYFATGNTPARLGNAHYLLAPCNTYRTADDREVLIYAHSPKFWDAVVTALGDAALAADPRFQDKGVRLDNRIALDAAIGAIVRRRPLADWIARLDSAGALFAPVRSLPEVFSDPEVRPEMVVELDHPTAGRVSVLNNPLHFSDTPTSVRRPSPLLGQHTDEVVGGNGWENNPHPPPSPAEAVEGTPQSRSR